MRGLFGKAAAVAAAFVLACAPAVSNPAQASVQPDVVGGTPTDEAYPFMTSLADGDGHFCGASLIRSNWLVTAAHCVDGVSADTLTARIGSADRTEGGEVAQPAELVVHPSYTAPGSPNDLALVRLAEPVTATPIDIAESAEPGTATRLLGWGRTCAQDGCGESPVMLQQLDTRVVQDDRCAAGFTARSEVCTGNPDGGGACYGDSGGPQIVRDGDRWRLIGMSSRAGNDDAVCGTAPSIYTSAPAHRTWIDETIAA